MSIRSTIRSLHYPAADARTALLHIMFPPVSGFAAHLEQVLADREEGEEVAEPECICGPYFHPDCPRGCLAASYGVSGGPEGGVGVVLGDCGLYDVGPAEVDDPNGLGGLIGRMPSDGRSYISTIVGSDSTWVPPVLTPYKEPGEDRLDRIESLLEQIRDSLRPRGFVVTDGLSSDRTWTGASPAEAHKEALTRAGLAEVEDWHGKTTKQ